MISIFKDLLDTMVGNPDLGRIWNIGSCTITVNGKDYVATMSGVKVRVVNYESPYHIQLIMDVVEGPPCEAGPAKAKIKWDSYAGSDDEYIPLP